MTSRLPLLPDLRGAALCLLLALGPAAAAEPYRAGPATCDGWPRAPIGMAPGYCAGLVVMPPEKFSTRAIRLPRLLLPLPGGTDWLVTDLGVWNAKRGKLWRLHVVRGQPVQMTALLTGLVMPHGLARGPDGKIYVGEMQRIFRFDPDASDPARTIEMVVGNLPDNRLHDARHPLSGFVFDHDGALLVNVGAPSDQCALPDGKPNGGKTCAEAEGAAGIRRYAYLGHGAWGQDYTMLARGLRNTLALVRHASGTLLAAENGIDFHDRDEPFEALYLLRPGAHYGWPYCYDMDKPTPVWAGTGAMDCRSSAHAQPLQLLPPHAAPLGMVYYDGTLFPALRGRLLMTWHGYVASGSRLAAFATDAKGVPLTAAKARYDIYGAGTSLTSEPYPGPAAQAQILTPHWNAQAGTRPKGTPVGLAVAQDGAIWMTEDKNATILRIAPDRP